MFKFEGCSMENLDFFFVWIKLSNKKFQDFWQKESSNLCAPKRCVWIRRILIRDIFDIKPDRRTKNLHFSTANAGAHGPDDEPTRTYCWWAKWGAAMSAGDFPIAGGAECVAASQSVGRVRDSNCRPTDGHTIHWHYYFDCHSQCWPVSLASTESLSWCQTNLSMATTTAPACDSHSPLYCPAADSDWDVHCRQC